MHGPNSDIPRLSLAQQPVLDAANGDPNGTAAEQSCAEEFSLIRQQVDPTARDQSLGSEQPSPGIACESTHCPLSA